MSARSGSPAAAGASPLGARAASVGRPPDGRGRGGARFELGAHARAAGGMPRCCGRMTPSTAVSFARWMRFCSSRTLPGHSYCCSVKARLVRQLRGRRAVDAREQLEEMLGQQHHVVGPLAQRRQRQLDDVEAEVEVLPELAAAIARCRSVLVALTMRTSALRVPLDPEASNRPSAARAAACLTGQRQVADLVEEQRAAVRRLEASDARLVGARERARLGAEQLRLQQVVGQGARR
jgi:hypothetical protein